MAMLPKTISGVIGGVRRLDPGVAARGRRSRPARRCRRGRSRWRTRLGQLIAQLVGGVGGGGLLTAIVGQFLGKR